MCDDAAAEAWRALQPKAPRSSVPSRALCCHMFAELDRKNSHGQHLSLPPLVMPASPQRAPTVPQEGRQVRSILRTLPGDCRRRIATRNRRCNSRDLADILRHCVARAGLQVRNRSTWRVRDEFSPYLKVRWPCADMCSHAATCHVARTQAGGPQLYWLPGVRRVRAADQIHRIRTGGAHVAHEGSALPPDLRSAFVWPAKCYVMSAA